MAIPPHAFLAPAPSRSERARTELLEVAVEVFGEKGPRGATVREIARKAGQNVAAIAYYFGSKQNLYRAVLEGVVSEMRRRLADVLEELRSLRVQAHPAPAEARLALKRFLRSVYLRLLSRDEAAPIVQLIVREQLGPTPAFSILYEQAFRELHEGLCFLVGAVLGRNPREREIILRTHMLMGQVYFFAMSREAIRRRLGWRTLAGKNAELVAKVLDGNTDALLSGLTMTSEITKRSCRPRSLARRHGV